jgi:ribosomal protein S3
MKMKQTLREQMIHAARQHAEAHVEKHRMNIEIYLTNPVGVGEHSELMEEIEKQLDEMARYQDHIDILDHYF